MTKAAAKSNRPQRSAGAGAKPAAKPAAPALTGHGGAANAAFNTGTGVMCKLQPLAKTALAGLDTELHRPLQETYSILCSARTELVRHYYEVGCVLLPVFEKYKKGGIAAIYQKLQELDQHAPGSDAIYHAIRFALNVPLREAQAIFNTKLPWGVVRRLICKDDPATRAELMALAVDEKMTADTFGAYLASLDNPTAAVAAVPAAAKGGRPYNMPKTYQASVMKLDEVTRRNNEYMTALTTTLSTQVEELKQQPREEWLPELQTSAIKIRKQLLEAQEITNRQLMLVDALIDATPAEAVASTAPRVSTRPARHTAQAGVSND